MKYTELNFSNNKFYTYTKDTLNSYTKNKLYSSLGSHHMYIDTDKIEEGKAKFKKHILKYYKNILSEVENI